MTKKSNSLYTKEQKSFLDYMQLLVLILIFSSLGFLEFKSIWFSATPALDESPVFVAQEALETPKAAVEPVTEPLRTPSVVASTPPKSQPVVNEPVQSVAVTPAVVVEPPKESIPLISQAQKMGNDAFIAHLKANKADISPTERAELMADSIESKNSVLLYGLAYVDDFWSAVEKEQLLRYFVLTGQANATESLIKYGYTTSLDYAQVKELIRTRYYRLAMLAIEHNFIPYDARDAEGFTLLHEASAKGHEGLVRQLVAKGLSVNVVSKNGISALHYPVYWGFKMTASVLLELGIDPNIEATANYSGIDWAKTTPLHVAAERGWGEIVTLLLTKGADATCVDARGRTPLEVAKSAEVSALFKNIE